MKKKITTLLTTACMLMLVFSLKAEATTTEEGSSEDFEEGIDINYVTKVMKELSRIGESYLRGRCYGTDGEYVAQDYIKGEMQALIWHLFWIVTSSIKSKK
jgi:hypothetical protein